MQPNSGKENVDKLGRAHYKYNIHINKTSIHHNKSHILNDSIKRKERERESNKKTAFPSDSLADVGRPTSIDTCNQIKLADKTTLITSGRWWAGWQQATGKRGGGWESEKRSTHVGNMKSTSVRRLIKSVNEPLASKSTNTNRHRQKKRDKMRERERDPATGRGIGGLQRRICM